MSRLPERPIPLDSNSCLDDLEWRSFRVDDVLAELFDLDRHDPIVPSVMASDLEQLLPESIPRVGCGFSQVKSNLAGLMNRFSRRNRHPGFMAYICSPGLPSDWAAFAWVAALNQNVTSYGSAPAAITLERRLIRWLAEMVGLPGSSGGLMTSGGSMANLSAIASALHEFVGPKLRKFGFAGFGSASPFFTYANPAAHFSVVRAATVLGLGESNVRMVKTDEQGRMRIDELKQMLSSDYHRGGKPFCVVATAGTTAAGVIDPLSGVAEVCRDNGLWMHVDGAYGAGAMICPELREKFTGIESADSITIDLHKWLYTSIDASVLLLRDPKLTLDLCHVEANYVQSSVEECPEQFAMYHYSLETSRRLRALPFVMAVMHFGADRIAANILHNVRCAEYLGQCVESSTDFELACPTQLSICCFRFNPSNLSLPSKVVDECNLQLLARLNGEGRFHLSNCTIDGRPILRACIVSYATDAEHIDELLRSILRLGRIVLREMNF